jgi:hypothetical protein
MNNCARCDRQLDPSDLFCDGCGSPVTRTEKPADSPGTILLGEAPAAGVPVTQAAPGTGMPPLELTNPAPATGGWRQADAAAGSQAPRFRLAQDEHVLKTYEAVVLRPGLLRRRRGHGTLYVTDARVVFYALVYPRGTQRQSWLLQQTKLEDISGLHADVSRRVSLGLLVLTAFFGLATIGTLVTLVLPLTLLFAILTVLCAALMMWDAARRGSVNIEIQARGYNASSIRFGHLGGERFFDQMVRYLFFPILFFVKFYGAGDVAAGDPGADADQLLHELGALILDLQTRGTMSYPHWGITEAVGARAVDAQ